MKTVSGKLISSKPLSISKAAKILSTFVAVDNGASPAISVYLRRASEAFDELAQFHKELKVPKSKRKSKKSLPDLVNAPSQEIEAHNNHEDVESDRRKSKKGKKMGQGGSSNTVQFEGDFRESEIRSGVEEELDGNMRHNLANGNQKYMGLEKEKKKHKSKKQHEGKSKDGHVVESSDLDGRRDGGSKAYAKKKDQESSELEEREGDDSSKKKEKNKNKKGVEVSTAQDNGVIGEAFDRKVEENGERKKRKSTEVVEGGMEDGSVEKHSKKTKKRRTED